MRAYEYYLFDADGTLIDTIELIYQSFRHTLNAYTERPIDRDTIVRYIGLPLRTQLQQHLGPLTEDEIRAISRFHLDHQLEIYKTHLKPFPGIKDVLLRLRRGNRGLAVVTSRMPETLELYLDHTGLLPYFDALITPRDTVNHKPHPDPVLKALELLGGSPSEALMIGDADFDILSGTRAGTDTALVTWCGTCGSAPSPSPTYLLHSPSDLLAEP